MQRSLLALLVVGAMLMVSVMQLPVFSANPPGPIKVPSPYGLSPCYQETIYDSLVLPTSEPLGTSPGSALSPSYWAIPSTVYTYETNAIVTTDSQYQGNSVILTDPYNNEYNPVFVVGFAPVFSGSFNGLFGISYGINSSDNIYGMLLLLTKVGNSYHLNGYIDGNLELNASVGQINSGQVYVMGLAYNSTTENFAFLWSNSTGQYSYYFTAEVGIPLELTNQNYAIGLASPTGQTIQWHITAFSLPDN